MLIFYLVPEMLKKKRRQEEYKYPEIPDQVPPPGPDRVPPPAGRRPEEERPLPPPVPARMPVPDIVLPPADDERPRPAASVHRPPQPHPQPPEPNYVPQEEPAVAVAVAEPRPWDGKLDQAAVVNGIIFAEIIQPPRCKRPFRHGFGR
jgi:hypothetical protein